MAGLIYLDRKSCEGALGKYYQKVEERAAQLFWGDLFKMVLKEKEIVAAHVEDGVFFILYPSLNDEQGIASCQMAVKAALEKILEFGPQRVMYSLSETEKLDFIDAPYWKWLPKEYSELLQSKGFGTTIYVSLPWLYTYLSKLIFDLNEVSGIELSIISNMDAFLGSGVFQFKCGKGELQMNVIRLLMKMVFGGFTKEFFSKILASDAKEAALLEKKGKLDGVTSIGLGKIPRKY